MCTVSKKTLRKKSVKTKHAAHQVEGYTEQEKPQDIVELVPDNNFDTLSEHDKYIVLKNRFVPEANFDFPKTIKHGCNRSCKTACLCLSLFL